MKVLRCDEHDLQAIEEIHSRSPLDPSVLVTRYQQEMGSAIIEPRRLRAQLLVAIERLFPDQVDAIARRLEAPQGRRG
jgi:hypothetical protein